MILEERVMAKSFKKEDLTTTKITKRHEKAPPSQRSTVRQERNVLPLKLLFSCFFL